MATFRTWSLLSTCLRSECDASQTRFLWCKPGQLCLNAHNFIRKTTHSRPTVGFCLTKYVPPPKVLSAMFAQSQWSVFNGCLRHWRWVNSFSSSNFKPSPFDHQWFFVVSSQFLASSIRQFNCLHFIQNLPLHCQCQLNVFFFVVGKR